MRSKATCLEILGSCCSAFRTATSVSRLADGIFDCAGGDKPRYTQSHRTRTRRRLTSVIPLSQTRPCRGVLQPATFHMSEKAAQKIELDFFLFFAFWQRKHKKTQKSTSEESPCIFGKHIIFVVTSQITVPSSQPYFPLVCRAASQMTIGEPNQVFFF